MPAVEGVGRLAALAVDDGSHLAERLLGHLARIGVEEDARPVGADRDASAKGAAGLVFELVLVERALEPVSGAELDGDAPVLGHRQAIRGAPTEAGISGFQPGSVGSRERASSASCSQAATNASTADSTVS